MGIAPAVARVELLPVDDSDVHKKSQVRDSPRKPFLPATAERVAVATADEVTTARGVLPVLVAEATPSQSTSRTLSAPPSPPPPAAVALTRLDYVSKVIELTWAHVDATGQAKLIQHGICPKCVMTPHTCTHCYACARNVRCDCFIEGRKPRPFPSKSTLV